MEATAMPHSGIIALVGQSGPVVKLVLILLVLASVVCWAIIFVKMLSLKRASAQDQSFLKLFWSSKSLDDIFEKSDVYRYSPVAIVFMAGFKELQKLTSTERTTGGRQEVDNIQRALMRAGNSAVENLEKNVSILATTASAAPFVGLFGTVWGIMNSFLGIGQTGQANLAVVAPGISEALIATAVGLGAAIPAVVAYNHFAAKIKRLATDMDCFSNDFLNIVQRGLMGNTKPGKK